MKKTLLNKGLKYNNSIIIFRDPTVRVHCVTMIDCPLNYKITDLVRLMSEFGTVYQGYEVTKTLENITYKNGNRVFQFSSLSELPPKRFYLDGHQVRLVYSAPHISLLTEEFKEKINNWGAGTTGESREEEEPPRVRQQQQQQPQRRQEQQRQDQREQQQQQQHGTEEMEVIPETPEAVTGRKRSVGETGAVEKKKPLLDSQPISSFSSTQSTPVSPAVV